MQGVLYTYLGSIIHVPRKHLCVIQGAPTQMQGAHNAHAGSITRTQGTLIHVLAAGRACVARGAGADGLAIDRIGVAVRAFIAGVADTGVVEVTQQAWEQRGCQQALSGP